MDRRGDQCRTEQADQASLRQYAIRVRTPCRSPSIRRRQERPRRTAQTTHEWNRLAGIDRERAALKLELQQVHASLVECAKQTADHFAAAPDIE